MNPAPIEIAVALLCRRDGRTLVVRKRGTATFIQPGGKLEPGERPADALCRELEEELGLRITPADLAFAGSYDGPAVNEPGTVVAHAFRLTVDVPVSAAAEIEELAWIDPAHPGDIVLAPLTRDCFLPLLTPWKEKAVVVTGGAKGIGRYIALGAARAGANVAICDIDDAALHATKRELEACGGKSLALHVDVRDEDGAQQLIAQTAQAFGTIDYLVNNAAIVPHFQWGGPRWPRVRDMDLAFWTNVIATNLHGAFLCSKHAIPYMERQNSGHIVNLYGGGAAVPPGAMAYVITKEALVVFSRYLAEEVREHNICVMSLAPGGAIATEWAPEEARRRLPGPDSAGDRFLLAADAPMELSGHLVDFIDGKLVAVN
jgi:8-oxo-dGTP diphosphatase